MAEEDLDELRECFVCQRNCNCEGCQENDSSPEVESRRRTAKKPRRRPCKAKASKSKLSCIPAKRTLRKLKKGEYLDGGDGGSKKDLRKRREEYREDMEPRMEVQRSYVHVQNLERYRTDPREFQPCPPFACYPAMIFNPNQAPQLLVMNSASAYAPLIYPNQPPFFLFPNGGHGFPLPTQVAGNKTVGEVERRTNN